VSGAAVFAITAGCAPRSESTGTAAVTHNSTADVRVAAAGDIAASPTSAEGTARLIESLAPDAVVTLGDNAYTEGSTAQYRTYYNPTWGQFRDITHPAPGNHDYYTADAAGYFRYFADQVGGRPYYAWNAGGWRMYSLNCEIACGKGSAQLRWLRHDLAAIGDRPALGYLHEPLFTCSTGHAPSTKGRGIWRVLDRNGGRILLTGHNHAYERFARQHAFGQLSRNGLREFVVGTGGAERYPLLSSCRHRQAGVDGVDGVLVLRLSPVEYSWRFVGADGRGRDHGTTPIR
jgi:3',5'-cyclic AMP phosphodiesterase CpdA